MKFDTILIGPPSPKHDAYSGSSSKWSYPTLEPDELRALPIGDLSKPGTHLWPWTTHTHLPLAMELIPLWKYQVCATAIKPSGFGNWWPKTTQFLLFSYRSPLKMLRKCQPTHFEYKPSRHSVKPEESYRLISKSRNKARVIRAEYRMVSSWE